ncbi:hypothetical protein MTO96_039159 [Rhipicephalus appendiculatus]
MPDLPTDDYKVVVRPRGGFNVADYKTDRIYCCLRSAAEIGREAAEEERICLNFKQNIVVLSTPSEDRAKRYRAISKLRIGERAFEASAYRAAPENTSKGLVRGICNDEIPENIVKSLVTQRNPGVLHAKTHGKHGQRDRPFRRFLRAEICVLRSDAPQMQPIQEAHRRVL